MNPQIAAAMYQLQYQRAMADSMNGRVGHKGAISDQNDAFNAFQRYSDRAKNVAYNDKGLY